MVNLTFQTPVRDHNDNSVLGMAYRKSGNKHSPSVIGQNVWLGNKKREPRRLDTRLYRSTPKNENRFH